MLAMSSAFNGPFFDHKRTDRGSFDLDAAIRQWALFIDRIGERLAFYSVESVHAQKWYSESEMEYIRTVDYDLYADGRHRIEMHRDTGPFSKYQIQKHLKGRLRSLRTRRLRYDPDWVDQTDIGEPVVGLQPVTFDRWILKP